MTVSEARELILAHAVAVPFESHPRVANGFIGMLRPYNGLIERNFDEVMQALHTLAPLFQKDAILDRALMTALWDICITTRSWALDPEGMIRRNDLITSDDIARLSNWLDTISEAVSNLLEFGNVEGVNDSNSLH